MLCFGMFKIFQLIILFLLSNCNAPDKPQKIRSFDKIKSLGKLRVVTTNSPLTYYENKDGIIEGFEHDMILSFAKTKNLDVKFIIKDSVSEVFEALDLKKADIAMANLTITSKRQEDYIFTSPYREVQQKVICKPYIRPKKPKELKKFKILIGADTSHEDTVEELKQSYPELNYKVTQHKTNQEIFQELANEKSSVDCTITDSTIANLYLRYFPSLESPMNIGNPGKIAWAMQAHLTELRQSASVWIESAQKQGLIARWEDKYYSHFKDFDPYDLKKFLNRTKTRLPQFKTLFQKYAQIPPPSVDWKLLAAISYQESHWNPKAVSPTGVRGLMMLTKNTAKSVGVTNRVDPEQSIMGGAKYLKRLMNQVSKHINPEDRIWVALASYNVGAGHVRDARGLAAWEEKNPNNWAGIKAALPLLSVRKYYKRLPHGYARGLEPVIYVRRIRHYYDLLKKKL